MFVGEDYWVARKVVALSGSKRTDSLWVRTEIFDSTDALGATMLLNLASLKESYAAYDPEYALLQKT